MQKKTIFLLILLFMTAPASQIDAPIYNPLEEMRGKIIELTDKIKSLHEEVNKWKKKAEVSIEENRINTVSDEILQYYRDAGYIEEKNPFARDPEHLKQVYKYAVKYKELLSTEAAEICKRSNIIPEVFLMLWINEQTHFNPLVEYANKDAFGRVISVDRSITQINSGSRLDKKTNLRYYTTEAWDYGFSQLPEGLKKKKVASVHKDVEIGIAMFYIWVNERVRLKMPFAMASNWSLYSRLNKALEKYRKEG